MNRFWNIDENLTTDNTGQILLLASPGTGSTRWGEPLDVGGYCQLTTHWITDTPIPEMNQWGESVILSLSDPGTGDALELTLRRYRNAVGYYQVHLDARYENPLDGLSLDGLLEVWSTPVPSAGESDPLSDVRVCITRDSLRDGLQLRLSSGDSSESILNVGITPALFRDETAAARFTSSILNGRSVILGVSSPESGTAGWQLTAPEITKPDDTISQNFFTVDPAWKARLIDGEIAFSTVNAVSGWTKYRRPLLTEQPIHFTYQIAAEAADLTMELKNASGTAAFLFRFRADGSAVSGTAPDGTPLFTPVSFASAGTEYAVDVLVDAGTVTLTLSDLNGTELCRIPVTHDFFTGSSLNLIFASDGNGACTLSRFRGLPEVITADRRSLPFTKVVLAGDLVGDWVDPLIADMEEYQCGTVDTVTTAMTAREILDANGDLIILAGGVSQRTAGVSSEAYADSLRTLIRELKQNSMLGTVILVTGLPPAPDLDAAAYNAAIRSVADDAGIMYADLCATLGMSSWTLAEDGSLSNIGALLVAGEILQELMRGCSCLAVNATTDLQITVMADADKTKSALTAFCAADTPEAMKKAVENAALDANLDLYRSLSSEVQELVIDALCSCDRSDIGTHAEADALINQFVISVSAANPRKIRTGAPFVTYVAVGDSVSAGQVTVNHSTDGWVPRFARLVSAAQEAEVTLINNAISGTRMCTITDNKVFPAAKDTVRDYIVAHDPDLLTIAYGFNDLNAGTSLTEFIETYRGYLTEIREACPDTVIVLCGVYATPGDNNGAAIRRWNAALKELAEEFDVIYADTYYDILGSGWLIADGVHPTNAGHRVMANSVFRTLCRHMDLTGTTQPQPEPDQTTDPEPVQTAEPEPADTAAPAPERKTPSALPWLGAVALAAVAGVTLWFRKRKKK